MIAFMEWFYQLVQLRNSLTQIMNGTLLSCEPLAVALLNGINRRFGSQLELQMPAAKFATIAATSHPKYKLRWIPPDQRESVRLMFNQCVQSVFEHTNSQHQVSSY